MKIEQCTTMKKKKKRTQAYFKNII